MFLLDLMCTSWVQCLFSFFVFLLKGLPISRNIQERSIAHCMFPSMPNRHGGGKQSNIASESSTTAYQRTCIETHRMCSRVAVGALPMPCKCTAAGSKCIQSSRTACQQGPGQALCSRLPAKCNAGGTCVQCQFENCF